MLNLDAIDRTTMQSVPYSYAVIENLLPKAARLELAASFPQEQFRLSIGSGYGYLWSEMRSDNSWHMVTPVASTALQYRLALRIAFFTILMQVLSR
ncbi:hypothetical protein [Nostoc sp. PCC 9305]|uniref:hypothetical protein n=1 Tax=Nostoc sp. PCC 9305 TaxID=296636 RepID=UPI0039C5B8C1